MKDQRKKMRLAVREKRIHSGTVLDSPERTVVSCNLSDSEQHNKHTQCCVMILMKMAREVETYSWVVLTNSVIVYSALSLLGETFD